MQNLLQRIAVLRAIRERVGIRYWRYVAAQRTITTLRASYADAELRNQQLTEENARLRHTREGATEPDYLATAEDAQKRHWYWRRKDPNAWTRSNGQGDDGHSRPRWRRHHKPRRSER